MVPLSCLQVFGTSYHIQGLWCPALPPAPPPPFPEPCLLPGARTALLLPPPYWLLVTSLCPKAPAPRCSPNSLVPHPLHAEHLCPCSPGPTHQQREGLWNEGLGPTSLLASSPIAAPPVAPRPPQPGPLLLTKEVPAFVGLCPSC